MVSRSPRRRMTGRGRSSRTPVPGSLSQRWAKREPRSQRRLFERGSTRLDRQSGPFAQQVVGLLQETASGLGRRDDGLGYGVIDVAAAVARARAIRWTKAPRPSGRCGFRRVVLEFESGMAWARIATVAAVVGLVAIAARSAIPSPEGAGVSLRVAYGAGCGLDERPRLAVPGDGCRPRARHRTPKRRRDYDRRHRHRSRPLGAGHRREASAHPRHTRAQVIVRDTNGHGTFVASLAAGAVNDGDGISGFGGDAQLLIVKADSSHGSFTAADEASAIRYAVDRGARIINLSISGTTTRGRAKGIRYAIDRGVLLIAAAGNEYATRQPRRVPGRARPAGGIERPGRRRPCRCCIDSRRRTRVVFEHRSWISLAAPGEGVSAPCPSSPPRRRIPESRCPVPAGCTAMRAAPPSPHQRSSGAAALVWGVNPSMTARDVARILKETASGNGTWTPELGFGVIDVAAAVDRAQGSTLALDALDRGAERAEPLVDALVALVDLVRGADRRLPFGQARRGASPSRRECRGSPCAGRRAAPAR